MEERKVSAENIMDKDNPERIFPILNKFDRIYSHYKNKTFCETYRLITGDKQYSDIEFTQLMDKYIEENNIK